MGLKGLVRVLHIDAKDPFALLYESSQSVANMEVDITKVSRRVGICESTRAFNT